MVRLLLLAFLLSAAPVSAQWSIEESQETDGLRSRPTATEASLVSDEGRLAWVYGCVQALSGRSYIEDLELYTEQSGRSLAAAQYDIASMAVGGSAPGGTRSVTRWGSTRTTRCAGSLACSAATTS